MIKNTFTSIAIILILATGANAQKLKQAFSKYESGDFDGAYQIFKKNTTHAKEAPAAFYGIGLVYASPQNAKNNKIIAYTNFAKAKSKFLTLEKEDAQNLSSQYQLDIGKINTAIDSMAAQEYRKAESKNTITAYQQFLRQYSEAPTYAQSARKRIAEIESSNRKQISYQAQARINEMEREWDAICKDPQFPQKTISQLSEFINQYAYSPQYPRDKVMELTLRLRKAAFSTGEPTSMHTFLKHFDVKLTDTEKQQLETAEHVYTSLPFMEPYNESHKYLYEQYIKKAAPCELAYVSVLKIMKPYIDEEKYDEAAQILQQYKPMFPGMENRIDKTIQLLTQKAPEFDSVQMLPQSINQFYVGYPVLSADGQTLYFAKYPIPFNHPSSQDKQFDEDIYLCDFNNGEYSNVRPLSSINKTSTYERPSAVHPDGSKLLYYTNSEIHIANLYNNNIVPFSYINKFAQSWISDAKFTNDGNAVLFCAISSEDMGFQYNRTTEMGHGNKLGNSDIYVCTKDQNGKWSEITNLGPSINTPYGEYCPVLASDMKTLYFSSDGHYGLGGTDIFVSRRLNDTSWTEWSEPVNLGRNINTSFDDNNLFISADGKKAFYSKNDNIYSFLLPQEVKAEPVATLEGVVKNNKNEILPAQISWEDLHNGKQIGTLDNNPQTGKFFVTLPLGKDYGYVIESQGYYPTSGNISTDSSSAPIQITNNITMISEKEIIDNGISIVLQNIFFETSKYDLKKESFNELKRLAKFIKESNGLMIEISGHTDNVGPKEFNQQLSLNRANSVKKYLISLGLPETSISTKGFGDSKPVDTNDTPEGRAHNRRVEFKVIKQK